MTPKQEFINLLQNIGKQQRLKLNEINNMLCEHIFADFQKHFEVFLPYLKNKKLTCQSVRYFKGFDIHFECTFIDGNLSKIFNFA